jgi:hypothetical protein
MESHPNSSSLIYARFPKVLCVIYVFFSIIFDFYYPNDFEIIEVAKLKVIDESEALVPFLLKSDSISFLQNLTWYLFFFILLESVGKIFLLVKFIGKLQGQPTNTKIKRLHNFSVLLILLLGGKFLVFMVNSFIENCNF